MFAIYDKDPAIWIPIIFHTIGGQAGRVDGAPGSLQGLSPQVQTQRPGSLWLPLNKRC